MKRRPHQQFAAWLVAAPLMALPACGATESGGDGTKRTNETAGASGIAGSASGASGASSDGGAGSAGSAGSTGTGGAAGSAGRGGSSSSAGSAGSGSVGRDDCTKDSECPPVACLVAPCPDSLCVLGEDGFHHCQPRNRPALTPCDGSPVGPSCCTSDASCTEKPDGMCVPFSTGYCGGAAPPPINECRYDECRADSDCKTKPNGVCTAGYPRRCDYGPCRKNADCTRAPGGTCTLAQVGSFCATPTVFCRYPTDACQQSSDCKGASQFGKVCVPRADRQGMVCQDALPPPP